MRKLFFLFLALVATTSLLAYDFQSGDLYYNITSETTVEVTYQQLGSSSNYSGFTSVTIPSTVTYNGTTYSVTSIGDGAFEDCSSFTSITIPNSVTSIGDYAFSGCSSLTSVTIPNSVTSIGNYTFDGCYFTKDHFINNSSLDAEANNYWDATIVDSDVDGILIKDNVVIKGRPNITCVVIPNSVTSIGESAFYGCSSLTSITIPNSVTSIGRGAFSGCSSLTSVTIPNSVTSIGNSAFSSCSSLTSITIPNSVTTIGDHAFQSCSSLTSITIPNSVTSIGEWAFHDCSSLTSVAIPNSVKSIGDDAFRDCSSLTSITIPNSVTSIGNLAFYGCSSLTSITIPNSVTSIGRIAFYGCSSLSSITIPDSVTSIGYYAFYGCSSLTSVTIGNSVISIGWGAFEYCSSLTSITIPESVTSIGDEAFWGCSSLDTINVEAVKPPYLGYRAFEENNTSIFYIPCGTLTAYEASNWAQYVSEFVEDCKVDSTVIIIYTSTDGHIVTPYDVAAFGANIVSNTYKYKDGIGTITFGSPVTSIGDYAFYGCSSLTSIIIPNSVTSIGWDAFEDCSSLTSITIPNSVTSIGDEAFRGCSSLTSVTIPNSVTSIGDEAFRGCSSLTSMFVEEGNTIYDSRNNCNAIIETASNTLIAGCQNTIIPNSVTSIGDDAFEYCTSLTSIAIPNSVTSIGDDAFAYCSSLTSIIIPNSVTSIGDWAFEYCSSLTSVTIGNSVTTIGDDAFYGCSSLTSVTIGNSVTSIGDDAFAYCSSLTSIICEATIPPTLGSNVFYGVSTSIPVYVPCRSENVYKAAFGWKEFTNIQEPQVEYAIQVSTSNSQMGSAIVVYNTSCGAQISATANYGYHFVQWSDGNTDNPRVLELTQDTVLTAEFALTIAGQCGDNLYWSYDETAKTISITGSGEMYDYTASTQPWLLFKEEIKEVIIANTATSIGTSAFEGCIRLGKVSIGTAMVNIGANAFAGCTRLYDIYVYATYPPFADESSFANYNVYLYVPCENQREYILDIVWGEFKFIECLGADEVEDTEDVEIDAGSTDVTITWPTEDNADTYTIVIKKNGQVVCTLVFDSFGRLLNISFAPGRDGNHPAQYAEAVASGGFRFTVTGLEEGTDYTYDITATDESDNTLATHSGEFTTQRNVPTDLENIDSQSPEAKVQKFLRDGQLIILRDGIEYNAIGVEL